MRNILQSQQDRPRVTCADQPGRPTTEEKCRMYIHDVGHRTHRDVPSKRVGVTVDGVETVFRSAYAAADVLRISDLMIRRMARRSVKGFRYLD